MTQTPAYRRGAEEALAAAKSGGFAKTHYFQLEDGKSTILRFITDAFYDPSKPEVESWITVDQHQRIPTKDRPADWGTSKWPEFMSAVCRKDQAFSGIHNECYICDFVVGNNGVKKPSPRTWALACLREQVLGDGSPELGGPEAKGRPVGTRDVTREVTLPAKEASEGQAAQPERTIQEKAVVVVNMGVKNFFGPLQGYASHYGTILDRDYLIRRVGASMDTTYNIIPLDPIPAKTESGESKILDLRDPDFAGRYATSTKLPEVIGEMASDQFYAKFFDPRYTVANESQVSATGAAPEAPRPSNDPTPEAMAELQSRIRDFGPQAQEQPVAAAAPAAAASGPIDLS